jgi:hypothetical protein
MVSGFSPGTPASSTTKTGRHDIAEIFAESGVKHQTSNQIILFLKELLPCKLFMIPI